VLEAEGERKWDDTFSVSGTNRSEMNDVGTAVTETDTQL
jgi:hypothetical protein